MKNSSTKDQIGLSKPRRIARTLEREIRSGIMPRGHQLQSENELRRRFSTSRTTVRKGLEELARQGFITTKSGIGSFVTYDGTTIDNTLGWTRSLTKTDARIETYVLEISQIRDPKLSTLLKITSSSSTKASANALCSLSMSNTKKLRAGSIFPKSILSSLISSVV